MSKPRGTPMNPFIRGEMGETPRQRHEQMLAMIKAAGESLDADRCPNGCGKLTIEGEAAMCFECDFIRSTEQPFTPAKDAGFYRRPTRKANRNAAAAVALAILSLFALPAAAQLKTGELWVGATANSGNFRIFVKQKSTTKGITVEGTTAGQVSLWSDNTNGYAGTITSHPFVLRSNNADACTISTSQNLSCVGEIKLTSTTTGVIKQLNHSVGEGLWQTVAYNAGDYTGNGSMTWTVQAGDLVLFKYMLVGKTMTVCFVISNTTVGGTLSTALQILIPGGYSAANNTNTAGLVYSDNFSALTLAFANINGTTIGCYKAGQANWSAATDATQVSATFTFEVN